MRTKIFLIFLMFTAFVSFAQQDAQYTQYMYNTINVNPAYAGSRGAIVEIYIYLCFGIANIEIK